MAWAKFLTERGWRRLLARRRFEGGPRPTGWKSRGAAAKWAPCEKASSCAHHTATAKGAHPATCPTLGTADQRPGGSPGPAFGAARALGRRTATFFIIAGPARWQSRRPAGSWQGHHDRQQQLPIGESRQEKNKRPAGQSLARRARSDAYGAWPVAGDPSQRSKPTRSCCWRPQRKIRAAARPARAIRGLRDEPSAMTRPRRSWPAPHRPHR